MRTMMYSDIIRRDVELPINSEKAKIVDITAIIKEKYWESHGVIIETGFLDSKAKYYPNTLLQDVSKEGKIKLKSTKRKHKKVGDLRLSRIKGTKILTHDEEDVGRVYDFEIFVDKEPWIIWKLLVNPLGLSPTKRRLKIGTKSIKEYKDGKLYLKSGWNRRD